MLLVHLPASSIYPLTEFFELFNFPAEIAEIAESGLKAIDYPVNAIFENIVCIEVHKDTYLQI